MQTFSNKEIEKYVGALSNFQRAIVLKMRGAVLSADSRMQEGIKWGSIAFFNKKNICGYRVAKNHITLLFMEGAALKDVHNVLTGEGAKARIIKVNQIEEVNTEAIQALVKECLDMGM